MDGLTYYDRLAENSPDHLVFADLISHANRFLNSLSAYRSGRNIEHLAGRRAEIDLRLIREISNPTYDEVIEGLTNYLERGVADDNISAIIDDLNASIGNLERLAKTTPISPPSSPSAPD